MKHKLLSACCGVALLCLLFLLPGCLKDSCRNSYKIYTPVYKTISAIRAEMKSSTAQPLQQTGKIYVFGQYILLNELNKGIHVIDNSNPAAPRNLSFVPIPGNVDMAVQGNYLYADCYSDIAVLNISDPSSITPVRFLNNVLPENHNFWGLQTNPDSVQIITGYLERDTTVDCNTWRRWNECMTCSFADAGGRPTMLSAAAPAPAGRGGSMARFTIAANFLYGVTNSSLHAFSLADATNPRKTNVINMGWGIETIYPFKNRLFIGSNNGVFIYDISNPSAPFRQGQFMHATSCDPVIADDAYAYVTLRSGTNCRGATINQLDVLNIGNLNAPSLYKTYPLQNPHGLDKDGHVLFVCDGKAGLKIFDAANPANIKQLKQFEGYEAFDVIAMNNNAIVVGKDGLYQYNYSQLDNIRLTSKIGISK